MSVSTKTKVLVEEEEEAEFCSLCMGLKRSFSSKFTDSEKSLAILPAGFKLVPGASGVAFI